MSYFVLSAESFKNKKSLLIKTIKKWLRPQEGTYKLLNEDLVCYSIDLGKMVTLKRGIIVEVVKTFDNKIVIKHNNDLFNLINDNFVYFNYWFIKVED